VVDVRVGASTPRMARAMWFCRSRIRRRVDDLAFADQQVHPIQHAGDTASVSNETEKSRIASRSPRVLLASREEILNMPESIISRMKAHRPLDARVAVNDTRFCRKLCGTVWVALYRGDCL